MLASSKADSISRLGAFGVVMEHAQVRALIANIERDLQNREALSSNEPRSIAELRSDWSALVKFLAIPPAPEVRACSHCGGEIRIDATLCKFCWNKYPAT
jgi:hypothetical protein